MSGRQPHVMFTLPAVAGAASLVAVASGIVPALRPAGVDPIAALRSD